MDHHSHGVESMATAWRIYLSIASEVEPRVLTSLLTDDAIARRGVRPDGIPIDESVTRFIRRTSNLSHIRAWCDLWHFKAAWAETPAVDTINAAAHSRITGCPYPDRIITTSLADNPAGSFFLTIATTAPLDLPQFTWSPTAETMEAATSRILAVVTSELERIRDTSLRRGYIPGRTKRSLDHFEWFARNRLIGESADVIANSLEDDDPRDIRTVQRGIKDVREALGLPAGTGKKGD